VPKTILVTDDDPGLQNFFRIILEKAGYVVNVVSNGNLLLQNKFSLPNLFLLDKQLSGYDGIEICKVLKHRKRTSHIPVIMISANPNISSLSSEAGADAYIEKPFQLKDFLATVKSHVGE
jgi:DNA-binding response OmpR family regulator